VKEIIAARDGQTDPIPRSLKTAIPEHLEKKIEGKWGKVGPRKRLTVTPQTPVH